MALIYIINLALVVSVSFANDYQSPAPSLYEPSEIVIPDGMSFAQVTSSLEIEYAYDPKTLTYARNKYNRAGDT